MCEYAYLLHVCLLYGEFGLLVLNTFYIHEKLLQVLTSCFMVYELAMVIYNA
jgi:hypothetical protein